MPGSQTHAAAADPSTVLLRYAALLPKPSAAALPATVRPSPSQAPPVTRTCLPPTPTNPPTSVNPPTVHPPTLDKQAEREAQPAREPVVIPVRAEAAHVGRAAAVGPTQSVAPAAAASHVPLSHSMEAKLRALELARESARAPAPTRPSPRGELRAELDAERERSESLYAELDRMRADLAERDEALKVALDGLHQARQQLARRDSECTHYRAEAARAVGQLQALTAHAEQQAWALREREKFVEPSTQPLAPVPVALSQVLKQ